MNFVVPNVIICGFVGLRSLKLREIKTMSLWSTNNGNEDTCSIAHKHSNTVQILYHYVYIKLWKFTLFKAGHCSEFLFNSCRYIVNIQTAAKFSVDDTVSSVAVKALVMQGGKPCYLPFLSITVSCWQTWYLSNRLRDRSFKGENFTQKTRKSRH